MCHQFIISLYSIHVLRRYQWVWRVSSILVLLLTFSEGVALLSCNYLNAILITHFLKNHSIIFIFRNRKNCVYYFGVMMRMIKIVFLLLYWFDFLILHHSDNKMAELNGAIFPSASHLLVFNNSKLLLLPAHHTNLPNLCLKCKERSKRGLEAIDI